VNEPLVAGREDVFVGAEFGSLVSRTTVARGANTRASGTVRVCQPASVWWLPPSSEPSSPVSTHSIV
jgi:hypothetical protein